MGCPAWRVSITLAIAVFLTLVQSGGGARAVGQEDSPADRFVGAVKELDKATQARLLDEVQDKLGIAPSPILVSCRETLSGYLMNVLRSGSVADAEALRERAYKQCTKLLQIRNPKATLNDANKGFADELAAEVLTQFRTSTAAGPVRSVAFRSPALEPQQIGNPNGVRPTDGSQTAGAGGGSQSPATPASNLPKLPDVLQLGANRSEMKKAFTEQDAGDVKAANDQFGLKLTPQQRADQLRKWYEAAPLPGVLGRASFPNTFSDLTKQNLTNISQLGDNDKAEIGKIITEVVGTTAVDLGGISTPTPSSNRQQTDTATQVGEGAISVLGDIFPQVTPFEGLADDAVQVLVPALERWRPLQRCYERRAAGWGIFGLRPSRGVYYTVP